MRKTFVERNRPQMTIWCKHIACWIPKATNTHTQVVYYSLLFHCNSGCRKAHQCYVSKYIACLVKLKNRTDYRFICGILQYCNCDYNFYIISGQRPLRHLLRQPTVLIWTYKYFVKSPTQYLHATMMLLFRITACDWRLRCEQNCEVLLISQRVLVKCR
jgi:hypothetical protein